MPKTITLTSPAKINLYLKVKKKRPDGFHDIVTLFERIDLCDTISFKENKSGKITIRCNHPDVPLGPKNLVHKVARLLKERYGIDKGVDIVIKKVIPVAAGLGGGSSNAATALIGLNRLWQIKLGKKQLVDLSRKIGSDVTFFLYDTSWALGKGRGDRIQPVNIKKKLSHLLIIPHVKLYASKVYGAFKFKLTRRRDNVNILIHRLRNTNINDVSSLMLNDLESSIITIQPSLLKLKKRLNSLNLQGVMISGSGPAVFAFTKNQQQGKRLKTLLSKTYTQVFIVKTR
jgi:4-diphosphocytidyl-2-C-methyl-D-erythritol kinase